MLTKTRSDFWKCGNMPERIGCTNNCTVEQCCTINIVPVGLNPVCMMCGYAPTVDDPCFMSATSVEVLIAWLSADDERRKEIEIASRPTKAGEYVRYEVGEVATIDTDFIILTPQNMEEMIELYPGCLWEPLSE